MTQLVVIACLAFDHRAPAEELQRFKACLLQCPQVEQAMEVCGTFDLIIQGSCSDVAEYTEGMERLREPLARFTTRAETSFVARTMNRPTAGAVRSGAMWLPCKDGRRRVEQGGTLHLRQRGRVRRLWEHRERELLLRARRTTGTREILPA